MLVQLLHAHLGRFCERVFAGDLMLVCEIDARGVSAG